VRESKCTAILAQAAVIRQFVGPPFIAAPPLLDPDPTMTPGDTFLLRSPVIAAFALLAACAGAPAGGTAAGPGMAEWPYRPIASREFVAERVGDCAYGYRGAGWVITSPRGSACSSSTARDLPPATRIEVTARPLSGPEVISYGLMFASDRTAERGDYYVLRVNSVGEYAMERWHGGHWDTPVRWTPHAAVRRGRRAENHIAVEITGNRLSMYVNGIHLGDHDAVRPLAGRAGVYNNGPLPEDAEAAAEILFTGLTATPHAPGPRRLGP
jgi:hypothetical protein